MIDREGTCAYLNRLLDERDAGQRTRASVVGRLVLILMCVDHQRAHRIVDSGCRFGVVDGRIAEVQS